MVIWELAGGTEKTCYTWCPMWYHVYLHETQEDQKQSSEHRDNRGFLVTVTSWIGMVCRDVATDCQQPASSHHVLSWAAQQLTQQFKICLKICRSALKTAPDQKFSEHVCVFKKNVHRLKKWL